MITMRYYFVQYRPDCSSREAMNWGILFYCEVPNGDTRILSVFEPKGVRLVQAYPNYPPKAHAVACEALKTAIESVSNTSLTRREVLHHIRSCLPLGHVLVKGGVDTIAPNELQTYVDDMYQYYVTRMHAHNQHAPKPKRKV